MSFFAFTVDIICNRRTKNNNDNMKTNPNKKNNHKITNIINVIIASSILFLGIILVLTSYPSLMNMSSSRDGIVPEEKEDNNYRDEFIYIFPYPFAIPIEFNTSYIIPLILTFIIVLTIILFIIILKSTKIF
jgi:hypothetical protein